MTKPYSGLLVTLRAPLGADSKLHKQASGAELTEGLRLKAYYYYYYCYCYYYM